LIFWYQSSQVATKNEFQIWLLQKQTFLFRLPFPKGLAWLGLTWLVLAWLGLN